MNRLIYRLLLQLHPPAFRRRFGTEILWIFDQQRGAKELWLDITISLLRQWFLRTPLWIAPLAFIGSLIVLALTTCTGSLTRRALNAIAVSPAAFILLATAGSMCAIVVTVLSSVAFFQSSRRRQRRNA